MQLIDSSERADTLFFKSVPEWDSNQLPLDYESEIQTTELSLQVSSKAVSKRVMLDRSESCYLRCFLYKEPASPSCSITYNAGIRKISILIDGFSTPKWAKQQIV